VTTDDPLIETIAVALHYGACDGTHEDCPFWVHHLERARAVYAAIAATGPLLPDGGTTEIQHRYRDPDGFTVVGISTEQIHDGDDWRLTDRRTVTHWPDGRWHFAPWEAVDDHA
jgi:hypothetical protein